MDRLYYYAYDDGSDFVNGEHYVTGTFSEAVAKRKVINDRIREQLGKKKYRLDNGFVKIKLIENVTNFAKKQNRFGKKTAPFDKWVMNKVYKKSERFKNKTGQYSECINIDPDKGTKKLIKFFKNGPTPPTPINPPELITPRDINHKKDIDKVKNDWNKNHDRILKQKGSIVITQEAACGSFKSTTWRLVYDTLVAPELKKLRKQSINLIGAPDRGIVKDLSTKNAGHDIKLGNKNKSLHLVYTDIEGKGNENVTQLIEERGVILVKPQPIKRNKLGKIIQKAKNKKEVLKDIIKDNPDKTIWVYTTFASYYRKRKNGTVSKNSLVYVMQDLKKSWSFKFIDEVHMTFQPDYSSWMKVHDNSVVDCKYSFLATATWPNFRNKKHNKKSIKNVNKKFRIGKYADFTFPTINNLDASQRGYIRSYKVRNYSFSLDHAKQIKDLVFAGKEPYFKVNGTDIVVPYTYYTNLTANFQSRLELGKKVSYTHVTVNSLANGRLLRDFINSTKNKLAEFLTGSTKNTGYELLSNIHVELMDTDDDESIKLRELADSIPKQYSNAIIIHCQLNEHGWNPGDSSGYKGFINSIQFFDPVQSTKRITQNSGRAARNPILQSECYLIQSHTYDPNDECHLNERWEKLANTCTALEIGKNSFGDVITLLDYQPKKRNSRVDRTTGRAIYESDFLTDGDFFVKNLKGWIDAGGLEHSLHQYHYVVYTPGADLLNEYEEFYKDKMYPLVKPKDVFHIRYKIGYNPSEIVKYLERKGYDTTVLKNLKNQKSSPNNKTYIFNTFCQYNFIKKDEKSKYIILPYTYMISDLLGWGRQGIGAGFYPGHQAVLVKKIHTNELGKYLEPVTQLEFLEHLQKWKPLSNKDFRFMRDLQNFKDWKKNNEVFEFHEKNYQVTKPDGKVLYLKKKMDVLPIIKTILKKLNLVSKADRATQIFKDGKIMISTTYKTRVKKVKGSNVTTGKGRGTKKWINGAPGWKFKEIYKFSCYVIKKSGVIKKPNAYPPGHVKNYTKAGGKNGNRNDKHQLIEFGIKHKLFKNIKKIYSQK